MVRFFTGLLVPVLLVVLLSCDVFLAPKAGLWNPKDPNYDPEVTTLKPELDGFVHGQDMGGYYITTRVFADPILEYDYCFWDTSGVAYTLMRFDLSQFPSSTFVDSALLTLNLTSVSGAPFPIQVDFCRIADSWDSRAVTYETVDDPAFISGSCVSGSLPETLTPDTYEMVVEITDIFKEWLSGSPNYGIRIKANANNYGVEGYATEAGSGGPTLTVTYGWIP